MEFVKAAQAYLMIDEDNVARATVWPWDGGFFKPKSAIKDLVRAGALIAAAIDRLQNDTED